MERVKVKVLIPSIILNSRRYEKGDVVVVSKDEAEVNARYGLVEVLEVIKPEKPKEEKKKSEDKPKSKPKRTTRKKKGMPKKAEIQEVKYETK